jgi:hypothetical protein
MYFLKNQIIVGVYLIKYLCETMSWAIFKTISVGNCLFSRLLLCILAGMGAYLPPLTPLTTTLFLGTPATNSWRTKQFLSRPCSL